MESRGNGFKAAGVSRSHALLALGRLPSGGSQLSVHSRRGPPAPWGHTVIVRVVLVPEPDSADDPPSGPHAVISRAIAPISTKTHLLLTDSLQMRPTG